MSGEYSINPSELSSVGDNIKQQAAKYIEKIDDVTRIVDGLSAIWGGETYDSFRESYYSHLASIEELNTILKEFGNIAIDTADNGEKIINNINNAMQG